MLASGLNAHERIIQYLPSSPKLLSNFLRVHWRAFHCMAERMPKDNVSFPPKSEFLERLSYYISYQIPRLERTGAPPQNPIAGKTLPVDLL